MVHVLTTDIIVLLSDSEENFDKNYEIILQKMSEEGYKIIIKKPKTVLYDQLVRRWDRGWDGR